MNLLAFDTCLDKTYITLSDGNNFINKVINSDSENYHSAYLISTIVEMLKSSFFFCCAGSSLLLTGAL